MTLRPARFQDVAAVADILSVSPGAAGWSHTSLQTFLSSLGVLALVSETDGSVSGFIISRKVGDEAEVLNVAVAPTCRRTGIGSTLLLAILDELARQNVSRVFLEVRESNASAIAFYQKHGFIAAGQRKGYYRDPAEDALLMDKKLADQKLTA